MKIKYLLLFLSFLTFNNVFAQGLIIHEQTGKDTVVISTVDSITFTQSLNVHKNIGSNLSIPISSIDSLSYDATINTFPLLSSIDPTMTTAGSQDFVLTVMGQNFKNTSIIQW